MNQEIIFPICLFIIGTCLGSFLSVVILRLLNHQKGILFGRSACPHCHKPLTPLELIPLLSWLWQKGRCQKCHQQISWQYPLLELASGLLLLTSYFALNQNLFSFGPMMADTLRTFPWIKLIYLEIINLTLLCICFSDLQKRTIPNLFLFFWIIITLPLFFLQDWISGAIALVVNLLFFAGQWFLSKGRWLGSGDIYFSIGMAFLLGWQKNFVAIIISYLIGSLIAIILLISNRANSKTPIAFTPFLILGTITALYFGPEMITWYLNFTY